MNLVSELEASHISAILILVVVAVSVCVYWIWDDGTLVKRWMVERATELPEVADETGLTLGPRAPTVPRQGLTPATESMFVQHWARMLRYEMNYPASVSEATRMAAHARLARLWDDDAPQLRKVDRARYAARVVGLSMLPDAAEVDTARFVASDAATERRRDVALPVTRRWSLFGYTLFEVRKKAQDFTK